MRKIADKVTFSLPSPEYYRSFSEYDNLVKIIAELGYIGIEIGICNPDNIDINLLSRSLKTKKLKLTAVGTGDAQLYNNISFSDKNFFIRKEAVERIKKDILFANKFNSKVLMGRIQGFPRDELEKKNGNKWIVECLKEAVIFAEEKSVIIALEPVNRFMSGFNHKVDDVLNIINLIDSSNLTILLDTFHMNIEEKSIAEAIKKSAKFVSHVNIADSNRGPIGTGHLNFLEVINTLEEIDYKGYYAVESDYVPDIISVAKISMNYIKNNFI